MAKKAASDAESETLRVRVLSAWSGHDFNHGYGAIIDLPRAMAEARIAKGLLEPAPAGSEVRAAFNADNAESLYLEKGRELEVAQNALASVTAERDELAAQIVALSEQIEQLTKPAQ